MNPIKDTLVPLRTNFNANGSVRWCSSVCLICSIGQWGKNQVIIMDFVYTFQLKEQSVLLHHKKLEKTKISGIEIAK